MQKESIPSKNTFLLLFLFFVIMETIARANIIMITVKRILMGDFVC